MNKTLKDKLTNTLREYAEDLIHDKRDIVEKLSEMNDIQNMLKILDNFEELRPVLQEYFAEKYKKEKWGNSDGR